jgi:hypothetical protein
MVEQQCLLGVILYRTRQPCPAPDVRFAPLATELAWRPNMTRWVKTRIIQCSKAGRYSITSSASASSMPGISRPSALAVVRRLLDGDVGRRSFYFRRAPSGQQGR